MERGVVLAVVILYCGFGVGFRDVQIALVLLHLANQFQYLHVHHVVDDDGILPFLAGFPGTSHSSFGDEAGCQIACAVAQDGQVFPVARDAIGMAIAAVEHETYIMRFLLVSNGFHALGKEFGILAQLLVLGLILA